MNWKEKEILITGGTGTLGKALTKLLIEKYHPKGIRIFSRDELKQSEMRKSYKNKQVSFLIGDIRDKERLSLACKNVNVIIHCAALKRVEVGEQNPIEAIKTNILGSQNVVLSALENKVDKVVGISTDKAVAPINLYGAAKMAMEKLFIHSNIYSAGRNPRFSVMRYGNVIGSRGSVIPIFKEQAKQGYFTITNPNATRFWIKIEDVAQFIVDRIEDMNGEEIFIPKMKSSTIEAVAKAINPNCEFRITELTPGEKLHETLITEEESLRTYKGNNYFVITPNKTDYYDKVFEYTSFNNFQKLDGKTLKKLIKEV